MKESNQLTEIELEAVTIELCDSLDGIVNLKKVSINIQPREPDVGIMNAYVQELEPLSYEVDQLDIRDILENHNISLSDIAQIKKVLNLVNKRISSSKNKPRATWSESYLEGSGRNLREHERSAAVVISELNFDGSEFDVDFDIGDVR